MQKSRKLDQVTKTADFFTTTNEINITRYWSQNANTRPKSVHWALETEWKAVFVHVLRTLCFSVSNASVILENSCCIKWPTALSFSPRSTSFKYRLSTALWKQAEEQDLVSYLKERVTGSWRMNWCKSWLKKAHLDLFSKCWPEHSVLGIQPNKRQINQPTSNVDANSHSLYVKKRRNLKHCSFVYTDVLFH